MAKSEQQGTAKKVFIVGLDHMVQKIVSKDFDIKTYHLLFCATLSRSYGFFKSWWTQSSGLLIEDCFRQSSELGWTTTPSTIWPGCWHWWYHTDIKRVWKVYYLHNKAFWGEPKQASRKVKKWLEMDQGREVGMDHILVKGWVVVRVSIHRLKLALFEFPPSTKGGSGWAILVTWKNIG